MWPALLEDGHAQGVVLDPRGAAAAVVDDVTWRRYYARMRACVAALDSAARSFRAAQRRVSGNLPRKSLWVFGFYAILGVPDAGFGAISSSLRRFSQRNGGRQR